MIAAFQVGVRAAPLGSELLTPFRAHWWLHAVPCADAEAKQSKGAAQNSLLSAVALCDHAGEVIYIGQTRGTIAIVDANSLRFLDVIKVGPPGPPCWPLSSHLSTCLSASTFD